MRAFKIRLYPTEEQKFLIDKTIGCCRFIYNQMLNERIAFYRDNKENKEILKSHKYKTEKEYKEGYLFLKEVPSRALQQSRNDLIKAFNNFFKLKRGFPNFKSRHKSKWSYREPQVGNQLRFEGKKINLPKLGLVKCRGLSLDFSGNIKSITITKRRDMVYEASILTDFSGVKKESKPNIVGIDLGIKSFVTLSTGEQINFPSMVNLEQKIKYQQKHLSRKQKGSNRGEKCRVKLARLLQKKTDILNHFLRHIVNKICNENQVIKIENLNVSGMLKNRKLSGKIHSVGWSKFVILLNQKSLDYNARVEVIDRFYPSSKTCSKCGNKKEDLKLSDRIYRCESCNLKIDRDLNAASNIKNYKSDELFDNRHGEAVNLVKKFFNFNTSSFDEVLTQKLADCKVC